MKNNSHTHKRSSIIKFGISLLWRKERVVVFILLLILILGNNVTNLFIPIFIRNIIDNIADIEFSFSGITPLVVIILIGGFAGFLQAICSTFLNQKVILDLRQKIVSHSLDQSMEYYTKEPIGRMVTRITKDLDETSNFFDILFSQIISSIISLVAIVVILVNLNSTLFMYTLAGVPLIMIFSKFYKEKVHKKSTLVREHTSRVNVYLSEHLQASTDLQVNNKTKESIENFREHNHTLFEKDRSLGINQTIVHPILNLIQMIMIAIICMSGVILANKSLVSIGTFLAYIQLINRLFRPLMNLAQASTQIQSSLVSLERLFSFLNINTALSVHVDNVAPVVQDDTVSKTSDIPAAQELEFRGVNFSYTPNTQVLHDVSFSVPVGKKVAIVGHSGSGKSTISKLSVRFWDVNEGKVLLNGSDIRHYPLPELRKKIVLLEQDSFIFKDSIRENICIGRDIAQDTLVHIAEKTGLSKLIESYPEAWEHIIDAKSISTGEQRLIAIARVLASPPDFIILDEFSATLDNNTEKRIQMLLEELQAERGTIVIAHRLHTIMQCDSILFIDEGRIVERGTHEELLALNGGYAQLISSSNL